MSDGQPLHPLLLRQLRRTGLLRADAWPPDAAAWQELLQRVSRSYTEHDNGHYLLERSQDLASAEMAELYAKVRADRDLLETRVRERTEALQLSQGRLSSLLSLSADWIWEQDEALRFTYFSDGLSSTLGVNPDSLMGTRRQAGAALDATPEAVARYEACVQARQAFRDFTYGYLRPDGVKRYIRVSGEPVFDAAGAFRGYRGVGRDVTDAALAERQIHELARYDSLTGLPNRRTFMAELDRSLARGRRHDLRFAVCYVDLDRFKIVNDRLGHAAGDELLSAMGHRLRAAVRENDLVARLGGDEFVVLVEGAGAGAELDCVTGKLMAAIVEPVSLQGELFLITGSIGVAVFPGDGEDAATLLRNADAAMYQAKEAGKNAVHQSTAELAERAARQFQLESELRLALARGELVLHFQPKFHLPERALSGLEALVRWRHPSRGMVPPGEFIPLAEERGLIVPLGRWVIEAACRQIRAWRDAGLTVPPVAVNLSARQFNSDSLFDDLAAALQRHRVDPAELELELTESVLMADPEHASAMLQRLHGLGLRISIDDFGTGYSSLSYLKRFPAQTVKIDRSFIDGLPADANDRAITQAVIALAHSLGLRVVAEGVETEQQLALLANLGCDEVQGFLLGRPMSAAALGERLGGSGVSMAAPTLQLVRPAARARRR